jgi:hypothetical protein
MNRKLSSVQWFLISFIELTLGRLHHSGGAHHGASVIPLNRTYGPARFDGGNGLHAVSGILLTVVLLIKLFSLGVLGFGKSEKSFVCTLFFTVILSYYLSIIKRIASSFGNCERLRWDQLTIDLLFDDLCLLEAMRNVD